MATAPFPVDATQTAIAVLYRNPRYIADAVLPRVPVTTKAFKWPVYPTGLSFKPVNTLISRRGRPNTVEVSADEQSAACEDYGLDWQVPNDDITQAAANGGVINPVFNHVAHTAELVALGREIRTAALVFGPTNYAPSLRAVLSGTSQFSDFTNSDPVGVISTALDAPLMRPNIMVIGQAAWSQLSRHPKIVKAIRGNDGGEGIVTRAQVATLFELEEVLVGQSRRDSAALGQPTNLVRIWGKHLALHYRNTPQAMATGQMTWGVTAEFGTRMAGSWEDRDVGARGGIRGRVVETLDELSVAPDCGYLLENVVA